MGWQWLVTILQYLKLGLKWMRKGVLVKVWAATSRQRILVLAALYYVVYENWAALTAFSQGPVPWFKSVVFAVGGSLIGADRTIEESVRALATGSFDPVVWTIDVAGVSYAVVSPEVVALSLLVAIAGALSTILIWVRASKLGVQSVNRNVGILGAVGVPVLVYALAVLAVSAVQGSPRIPFQGVYVLLQNLDVVSAVVQPFGNGSIPSGNMSVPGQELVENQSVK